MATDYGDLGSKLDLAGPSAFAQNTYNPGTTFHPGRCIKTTVELTIATDATSNLTSVGVKLQSSYDGTNFKDVQSVLQGGNDAEPKEEHTIAVAANGTIYRALETESLYGVSYARIVAKGTGGATKSGDRIIGYVKLS